MVPTQCEPICPKQSCKGLPHLQGKCLKHEQGHRLPNGHQLIRVDLRDVG